VVKMLKVKRFVLMSQTERKRKNVNFNQDNRKGPVSNVGQGRC
jgi:hypothetical protein